jgi:hypothetical protein
MRATDPINDHKRWMVRSLRTLFRPLVRLLIAEQVTYPIVSQVLKALYVDVAETDFRLPEKPQSDSRVALLTGVHRREVKRLRGSDEPDDSASELIPLSSRLIADWNALPQFLDEAGHPLPLNRSGRRPGPSLRDLAETAGQDIRAQAILDEWLRLGVVEVDEDGRIHLRAGSFVAEHGFEEKVDFFGRIIGAHITAGGHNLQDGEPPMLDQVVYYGGLRPKSLDKLSSRARELALVALRAWNREAAQMQEEDRGAPDANGRIHFGAYVSLDEEGLEHEDD